LLAKQVIVPSTRKVSTEPEFKCEGSGEDDRRRVERVRRQASYAAASEDEASSVNEEERV
jgi:hypothetical protein